MKNLLFFVYMRAYLIPKLTVFPFRMIPNLEPFRSPSTNGLLRALSDVA
jgi:hypothetical protein